MSVWNFSEIDFTLSEKQVYEKLKGVSVHANGSIVMGDEAYESLFLKYPLCVVFVDRNLGMIGLQPVGESHPDAEKAYAIMVSDSSKDSSKDKRPTISLKTMFKELGWSDRLTESVKLEDPKTILWRGRQMVVLDISRHLKHAAEEAS